MDRVAELERQVDNLHKRAEVTRHVAEDMSAYVSADPEKIALVVDNVLAHWAFKASDRPVAEVWRETANGVVGRRELARCAPKVPGAGGGRPVDQGLYFEMCWADYCEALQLNAILRAA